MTQISGWGRCPVVEGTERLSENLPEIVRGAQLSRGLGRSYGDASLPPAGGIVAGTRLADRVLSFDARSGVLRAEAGLSLERMNALFLPRGWSAPVSPGTQRVTLGGMVAADVHGKNHHVAGCFGEHVRALRMALADGRVLEVTEASEPELFCATLGGMGLTGHVLEVELSLAPIPSPWILRESERIESLDALIGRLREASANWPFTVAWVDGLSRGASPGRGILIKGRWAEPHEAPQVPPAFGRRLSVPCMLPRWVLGRRGARVFNTLLFRKHSREPRVSIEHPAAFFYPLDGLRHWYRLYGRSGFIQHQCVLPKTCDPGVPRRLLDELTRRGGSSFLSVIKDCGAEGRGLLSFPRPGISIALDIPMRGDRTRALVDALNEIVIDAGGRIYLAKDALTRREHLAAMEPRLEAFAAVRRRWDPEGRLASALSERLLDPVPASGVGVSSEAVGAKGVER